MSTPVINAIDNVNQSTLETLFGAIAADPTARDNLSQSNRNIDKVSTNAGVIGALDANENAILRILCRREGRDPSDFNTLDDVADDVSLVRDLSVRQTMAEIIRSSDKASSALSANDRATREMMCFPAGLDATTFTDVADVASDQAAMNTISANAQAMRLTLALPPARQEVTDSQTALQEVVASQTAMQEVTDSQTTIEVVAESQAFVSAFGSTSNENVAENTIMDSSSAASAFADSSLNTKKEQSFNDRSNASGTLTNDRMLVTSNNSFGSATNISFDTTSGTVGDDTGMYIINGANFSNNTNNDSRSGEVDIIGIVI